jgi:hypothetical protein
MSILAEPGQLTLVAFYGQKSKRYPHLWDRIRETQSMVRKILADNFEEYDEERVHGTIVGLEGIRVGGVVLNEHYFRRMGELRVMQIGALIEHLQSTALLPIELRVGGYRDGHQFPFTSRNAHPYLRSFSIQGTNVVAMGWPYAQGAYPTTIDRLRRTCNAFNVVHKYHDSPDAFDNDFFFVLGNLKNKPDEITTRECQDKLREFLSEAPWPPITLSTEDLSIVAYPVGDTKFKNAKAFALARVNTILGDLLEVYPSLT